MLPEPPLASQPSHILLPPGGAGPAVLIPQAWPGGCFFLEAFPDASGQVAAQAVFSPWPSPITASSTQCHLSPLLLLFPSPHPREVSCDHKHQSCTQRPLSRANRSGNQHNSHTLHSLTHLFTAGPSTKCGSQREQAPCLHHYGPTAQCAHSGAAQQALASLP